MFVDILAFEEVTILIGALLLAMAGVSAYLGLRRNDPAGVKNSLKSAAVPIGGVGVIATLLGLWGQVAWPLPGSYNILFTDVYLLFGTTMVVVAVSLAYTLKLQYAGMLALVVGGVTIAYGFQGWHLGLTKEPFEMFLLYGAFGLAGILALPATLVVDYYLAHVDGTKFAVSSGVSLARRTPSIQMATRAAQPIVPGVGTPTADDIDLLPKFRLPYYITATVIVFVAAMALAAIAALFFVDSTVPGHLASAP